ncbi:hypothetical protein TNCT_319481 [Trichonephila clavata]|uniref:Uncharacterized protein n=1 Tax=Trichonephila clavata TaxID=2740835 RepID=A0A8X6I5J7_TRICU|nr:hypothetical protein TNCT_319481 [Trichonephila clavata]
MVTSSSFGLDESSSETSHNFCFRQRMSVFITLCTRYLESFLPRSWGRRGVLTGILKSSFLLEFRSEVEGWAGDEPAASVSTQFCRCSVLFNLFCRRLSYRFILLSKPVEDSLSNNKIFINNNFDTEILCIKISKNL